MTRLAAALVAFLALHAGAEGAVRVDSALLRRPDAGVSEVGPGVYLTESQAVASANELVACRAKPASVEPPASPVAWLVASALVVAFGGGVAVGWWASTLKK